MRLDFLKKPERRTVLHLCCFFIVALSMSYYYVHLITFYNEYHHKASFELMMSYTADVPFQYRVLMVWIIKGTILALSALLNWPVDKSAAAIQDLMLHVEVLFVFGIVILFRIYLAQYFRSGIISSILAFTVFLILPYNYLLPPLYTQPFDHPPAVYHPIFYMYDLPSLFFFTLGLMLLKTRKLMPFYLFFAIATLNRETTCFLTMIYAFDAIGRERPSTVAAHVLAQLTIWGSVKYALYMLYGSNPGAGLFAVQFFSNLEFMSVLERLPTIVSNLGGLWIPVLLLYRYIPDRFARRASIVIVPFFIGMTIVGNVYELRIYGELIPVVLPALMLIIKELGLRFEHAGGQSEPEARLEYDI